MNWRCKLAWAGLALLGLAPVGRAAAEPGADPVETAEVRHPGLASGALTYARLAELPGGVLLRCGKLHLTTADLEKALRQAPGLAGEELRRNAFFILESEATPQLLARAAKAAAGDTGKKSERQVVEGYLDSVTAKVHVADDEIATFYEESRELLGDATLDALKEPIRQHLLEQKKEQAVREHIRTLGQRLKIEVSSAWADEQAPFALDNPADQARRSGKPSLVVFTGPCG